ncbi:glycoside hydrolase family 3 C-terminal domain-containing protein [Chloroflexus sp.]|uniref:glycoside hydrolase family 3 C-terminal domain-containing protein n=1 Tax=Chloroflexus sp. TaxID=1904827 RepID=UPI002ACD5C51|nr:glycoside hydrolase family 3 C-terminal domain-containing protein [Chloroflexus sp.]
MTNHIETLLTQLTLDEKIALVAGADAWHTVAIPRLGIPAIKVTDGPNGARGVSRNGTHTSACFPIGVAMGATWNPELVRQIGEALAEETKDKGAHILLAPTVNIHRSPLAGRNFECFSEDPYLTGVMASAYITGLQSRGVGACIKHFVCNDSEFERFSISSDVGERPLREIYLRPFELAIKQAKPWTIMSAYNRINGVWASENRRLLVEILKGEWQFDGLVMSDWYGTYSERATSNGLDLEMPGPARWLNRAHVLAAIERGELSEADLDDKVRRLLRTIERVGGFTNPTPAAEQANDRPAHRALIRRAGVESIVLLKNDGPVLPLDSEQSQTIAVIGANAHWAAIMGGGSSEVAPHYVATPLQGIRARASAQCIVDYAIGTPIFRRLPNLDPEWIRVPGSNPSGVRIDYFSNLDLSGAPVRTDHLATLEASWFGDQIEYLNLATFAARLSCDLLPPQSGRYQLGLSCVGQARIWLDDELVLDQWDKELMDSSERRQTITLVAGKHYRLAVEFRWPAPGNWRAVQVGLWPEREDDPIEEAVALAARSHVAIVFAGLTKEWESEGFDRIDMDLPGRQNELIRRVAAVNPRTIVVLNVGSPLQMPWLDEVAAVALAWYGGQEAGNAIADVLFGVADPGGRLPTTFPKRLADNPAYINYPGENGHVLYGEGLFVGYRYYDRKSVEPLFPFGFGLSYTTFAYRNLRLSAHTMRPDETIIVSVDVTNTGPRPGAEVVQLYVRDNAARLTRPDKELKGFAKITLQPGETTRVTFTIDRQALSYYDPAVPGWVAEPGEFVALVGRSAADIRLSAPFELV